MQRRQWMQSVGRLSLASGVVMGLSACGFQLRRPPDFAFQTLYCGLPENHPIWAKLRRTLEASGRVEVITDVRQVERAQVIFEQSGEAREKVIVGRTASGAIREFQLRLRYRFRLRSYTGKELIPDTDIVLTRDINFNETGALSKEAEEGLLYQDMENDLAQQLARRLAAVREL